MVSLSRPSLCRIQSFPSEIEGFTSSRSVNLHMDTETRGVYLFCVLDRRRSMNAILVHACTTEPIIYDCYELYAMRLLIDSFPTCCGEDTPTDYFETDDVLLVVPQGGGNVSQDQSERNRHHFLEKKVTNKAAKLYGVFELFWCLKCFISIHEFMFHFPTDYST